MASRFWVRAAVAGRAVLHRGIRYRRRQRPSNPRRILVVDHLLLGDTLMLTPLLAKLRQRFPDARIAMTMPAAIAPLYGGRPYGVEALAFDPRDLRSLDALSGSGGCDLAIVPADSRHAWLAAALDAGWIVAHEGDVPRYKNWPLDEQVPYPSKPAAWGDMVATLVDGSPPAPYRAGDWPAPAHAEFELPRKPYAVLHLGAGSPLRHWEPIKWRGLAERISGRGLDVVWSAGAAEAGLVAGADPSGARRSYAGKLDLAQLWRLIAGADLLVCPDTGIAHLGRVAGTRTVTLYGPGSATLFGAGDFWRASPCRAVTIEDFPCRNQRTLFRRDIEWVRRCERGPAECSAPACMQALDIDRVFAAACDLSANP